MHRVAIGLRLVRVSRFLVSPGFPFPRCDGPDWAAFCVSRYGPKRLPLCNEIARWPRTAYRVGVVFKRYLSKSVFCGLLCLHWIG